MFSKFTSHTQVYTVQTAEAMAQAKAVTVALKCAVIGTGEREGGHNGAVEHQVKRPKSVIFVMKILFPAACNDCL